MGADRLVSMVLEDPIFHLLTDPDDADPPAKAPRFASVTGALRFVSMTPKEPIFILLTPPETGLPAALAPPDTESNAEVEVFIVEDDPEDMSVPPVEPPENIEGSLLGLDFAGS